MPFPEPVHKNSDYRALVPFVGVIAMYVVARILVAVLDL